MGLTGFSLIRQKIWWNPKTRDSQHWALGSWCRTTWLGWFGMSKTRPVEAWLPLDANALVLDNLHHGHLAYEAYVQNHDKGENIKALEKWSNKLEFDDWDWKVTETLSPIYGCNFCPIAYVIRPDRPVGWDPAADATTDYERLRYQLALNGIAYEQDNEAVFS